jgi:hypothetical protein
VPRPIDPRSDPDRTLVARETLRGLAFAVAFLVLVLLVVLIAA